MNIFYLDHSVRNAAMFHCDKHCVKQILEYTQLLSTAHHVLDGNSPISYKPTHKNHPCSVWVRSSVNNYIYLWCLLFELIQEYSYRYKKEHKCKQYLEPLMYSPKNTPVTPFSYPPQCMPDDCKHSNVVTAYRQYYIKHKAWAEWRHSEWPMWFTMRNPWHEEIIIR